MQSRGIQELDNIPAPPKRFTPEDWEEIVGKVRQCGARTRKTGLPCKWPAGWGTDHFGVGRCMWHDYNPEKQTAPLLYYLDPELRNSVATYVNTDEILNLRTELAVLRIRFAAINNYDFDEMEGDEVRKWLREMTNLTKEITRLAEAITSMEQGMHKYIHISVTGSILGAVADVTKQFVPSDKLEEFMAQLNQAVREGMNRLTAKEVAVSALLPDTNYYTDKMRDPEKDEWDISV